MPIQLPFPPSTNNLFFNLPGGRGGRAPTKKYKGWQRQAAKAIHTQAPEIVKGPVILALVLGRPDKRKRDLSNYIKAVEDALVSHGVIEDDSMVQALTVSWGRAPGAQVYLWPYTAERAALQALAPESEAA